MTINKKVSSVVDDVIQQLQQLNTEMIINVNIEKNMLGKKSLHLNRNGLKQFANGLKLFENNENQRNHLTQNDTNKLIENQISSNSRITSIKDNNILHNFNYVNSNLNICSEHLKNLKLKVST